MPLTAAANEQQWQRIMGAPRDYSEDFLRGAQVAQMPFEDMLKEQGLGQEAMLKQQQMELEGRHYSAQERLAAAEQATTAAYRQQQQANQQQEMGIRQQAEQRAQQEFQQKKIVDSYMKPVYAAEAKARTQDMEEKAQMTQRALDNNTNDSKLWTAYVKRMDGLSDNAYSTGGGAQNVLDEYLGQFKTDVYQRKVEGLYNQRNAAINTKNNLATRSHWTTEGNAAHDAVIAGGGNEWQAMAAGNQANIVASKAQGLIPSGYRNEGRMIRDNEKDLDPKNVFDTTEKLFKNDPDFYPNQTKGADGTYSDSSMFDTQMPIFAGKLNALIHGRNGQPGHPDEARDLLSDPGKFKAFAQGKYDPLNPQTQTVNQDQGQPTPGQPGGGSNQQQDFMAKYFGTPGGNPNFNPTQIPTTEGDTSGGFNIQQPKGNVTPAASNAPAEPYSGPPKMTLPNQNQVPYRPGAQPQPQVQETQPQEIDQSSGGASANPASDSNAHLSLSSGYGPLVGHPAIPTNLEAYAPVFAEAGQKYGFDSKMLMAIAMQENVNPNDLNPLGISPNDGGPTHFQSMDDAKNAIFRQVAFMADPNSPYAKAKNIDEFANVYSPPGAPNDVNNTNATEAAGIKAKYALLGGSGGYASND